MSMLETIEDIKKLKYTYLRAVDTHDWSLLESTLTEDCQASYDGGKYRFANRQEIISGLSDMMGNPQTITQHQCHHPEIEVLSETTAKGRWYLQDLVFNLKDNWMLFGTALYEDEYRKVDGQWRKCRTGYERIMEMINAPIPETLNITHNMFDAK